MKAVFNVQCTEVRVRAKVLPRYYGTAGRAPEGLSGSLTRSDRAKLSTLGCEQFLVLPGPKSHHQAGLIKTSAYMYSPGAKLGKSHV